METEDSQVKRPERAADVVTPIGHAIWWEEMVFMHALYGWHKIQIDQENAALYVVIEGKRKNLGPKAEEMRDSWWYDIFESKVTGDEND